MGLVKVVNTRESRVGLAIERRGEPTESEPRGKLHIDELTLQGGANNVDADELKRFRGNPSVEALFSCGLLSVEGPVAEATIEQAPSGWIGDLSKLKPKAAKAAISACKDLRQLKAWIQQDGRPEIREALLKRHGEILKSSDAPAGEAETQD